MQWVHKLYNYILNVSIKCFYVVHFKKKKRTGKKDWFCVESIYKKKREGEIGEYKQKDKM